MHVHFMGICGSGISGVACIAASRGYRVSGCDLKESSTYSAQFSGPGIRFSVGHDAAHLEGADIVAVSPALMYKDKYKSIEESALAAEQGKLMKWQEFLGRYIFRGQQTVAVCGTSGKTTTTSLVGLALEQAGLDPTVLVGGIVPSWNRTFRNGQSDCYVVEADEYDNNFISYKPKYILLNNLEMEHPEIFRSFEEYRGVFERFILTIQEEGVIVVNAGCANAVALIDMLRPELESRRTRIIGFGVKDTDFKCERMYKATDIAVKDTVVFTVDGTPLSAHLIGMHNVCNITAAYAMARELCGDRLDMQSVLDGFNGAKRRMDVILDNGKVRLYNDYAHTHHQVQANMDALKHAYPDSDIIAVLEPHQISRLVENDREYIEGLALADSFYITEIFKGREADKELPDVHRMLRGYEGRGFYIRDNRVLVDEVAARVWGSDRKAIVIVMGAGESYKVADMLQAKLGA